MMVDYNPYVGIEVFHVGDSTDSGDAFIDGKGDEAGFHE